MLKLKNLLLLLVVSLAVGCELKFPASSEWTEEISPDVFVSGAVFEVQLRHTDVIDVEVVFPSDKDGVLTGQHPGVVFIQGGAVAPQRYLWWAKAVAAQGFVVALPQHAQNLAIFSLDNGSAARALLKAPPRGSLLEGHVADGPMAVFGHSLGGVVATKLALRKDFEVLGVFASYPDPADEKLLPTLTASTLFLAAKEDCQARLNVVKEGFLKIPSSKVLAVLPGATHFQFTDSDVPDFERGCAPTLSLEEAHVRFSSVSTAFLKAALSGNGVGLETLAEIPGVELP